jgi:hypothetical protein
LLGKKIAAKLHPGEMRAPNLNAVKYFNQLSQWDIVDRSGGFRFGQWVRFPP